MKHDSIEPTSSKKRAWTTPKIVAFPATPEMIEFIRSQTRGGPEDKTRA